MKRKDEDSFLEMENVASMTECTGLMSALPQTDAQDENSAALYNVHSGKNQRKKMYRKK